MNNKDQEVTFLHLDDIIPNRFQPREVFDERALKELAVSIKEHGVIQPIIVRSIKDNKYEIIAGERRYKASALAGLTKIPAIIRNLDDKEAAKVALLENLQRKNLNPIEEARTYQKIIELDQMTQEELAKTMGKSQSAVANKLRLLSLPEGIQKALLKEQISERHARSLLKLPSAEEQEKMLKRITTERLSVRKLEDEINNMTPKEEKIKDNEDLNSLINPKPVKVDNSEQKEEEKGASFLMTPPPTKDEEILNYGEIDEEASDEKVPIDDNLESNIISTEPLDINKLKNSSSDIGNILENDKSEQNEKDTLDSLLNLSNPKEEDTTTAEEALRESEEKDENKEDYFSVSDLMNVNLPNTDADAQASNFFNENQNKPIKNFDSLIDFNKKPNTTNDGSISNEELKETLNENKSDDKKSLGAALMGEAYNKQELKDEEYNIQEMVNKIRDTLKELESHGAKIDTDEMNFENQYQILIKIDKSSKN